MHFTEFFEIAWTLLVAHGFGVAWRIVLLTLVGSVLGVGLLWVCHRFLLGRGYLKLSLSWERYFEGLVLSLWVVLIPTLAVAAGALSGAWWAGNHLIAVEHLGERLGKSAFKALAAAMAATHLETSSDARAQVADDLMKGLQKISIKELSLYTSHHLGEVSAAKIFSAKTWPRFHGVTVWTVEKTVDLVTYAQLGDGGDVLYKLVGKIAEHDRHTDNDGQVTVEEISDVACKTYGDRGVRGLWAALVLQFILPLALLIGLLPLLPPLLAWSVRKFRRWRQGTKEEGSNQLAGGLQTDSQP